MILTFFIFLKIGQDTALWAAYYQQLYAQQMPGAAAAAASQTTTNSTAAAATAQTATAADGQDYSGMDFILKTIIKSLIFFTNIFSKLF